MQKPRCYAEVYNDLDEIIVTLFRVARDRGPELRRALELTPYSREEYKIAWEPSEDELESARRTIIRSAMGFGSAAATESRPNCRIMTGFRSNSNRSGTTPAHDWMNYPESLELIIKRLQGVVIENRDACTVMKHQDSPSTLHYVDPPYVTSSRTDGDADYRHELTDEDHEKLADCLHNLTGHVILSGYHSPLYDALYKDWHKAEKACHADGSRPRKEVLWMNFEAEKLLL